MVTCCFRDYFNYRNESKKTIFYKYHKKSCIISHACILYLQFYIKFQRLKNILIKELLKKQLWHINMMVIQSLNHKRAYEVFKILQYFNNNPSSLLLGFGSGAEIEIDKNVGKYILKKWDSRGTLHYIHNTYFSILFRYGIIGLLFFLYFIFKLCRIGFDKNKSKDKIDKFALVYLLICIIGFTQDFMIGVYLGILEWPFIFAMIINYKKIFQLK